MFPCVLALAPHGHVRLNYIDGSDLPIRNANSPTGNGRASVAGPCGGENAWGTNGNGVGQDGMSMTLNLVYAAGHTGTFEMAFACGDTTETALAAASAKLSAGCTCTKDGQATNYPCPGMNAGDEGVVTCPLPLQGLTIGETADCTVSLMDQRDWGGCVDVRMISAQAALPPAPPPLLWLSNAGTYDLTAAGSIDTSTDTFSCCAILGTLTIPDYSSDAASVTATLGATASNCRTSKEIVNPSYTNDMTLSTQVTLNVEAGSSINAYSGQVALGTPPQTFEVRVSDRVLELTMVDDDQPILCDAYSIGPVPPPPSLPPPSSSGLSGGALAGVISGAVVGGLLVLAAIVAGVWYWRRTGDFESV